MGLKMKNFYIMGIHQFLGEGVTKKQYRGNCIKRGDMDNLQGTWRKRERTVFLREGG